ncbi:MAG TPA: PLP-dependent aminotransferase family protein [Thermomicrobiales bacterium]|jgi:2-aminoadipate transaminase|nr:PLP-dependent aminotransferase family protein [Thermomicrobiales bacterium]
MTASTTTTDRSLLERTAARTRVFGESIWTGIFNQFTKHPDPVYFGDGSPAAEAFPLERLKEASQRAWDDAPASLGYGDQKGYPPLRELIAKRIAQRGITTTADEVLVTAGSTQAIDLACRAFLEPGDAVIVELPTFLGALEIFEMFETTIVGIPTDEHGMRMDALEAALVAHPEAKLIYTIPTFQNPSGTTLPLERRERMIELARRHTVAILEDDPYGELRYDGEVVPPLRALDDQVIHLGTFSKTIAPGVRTGFAIAPPEIYALMLAMREVTDISNDRIMMRTVYHTAVDFLDEHLVGARAIYRARRDAMLRALDEHMPAGVTWSRPEGGFFVWITLPDSVDGKQLFDDAAEKGVIFFPGEWFFPSRDLRHMIRLSFSTVPEDRIALGVERLGEAIRKHLG